MSDPIPLNELLHGWGIQSEVFHVAMKPTGDEMARRLRKLRERHQPQVRISGPGTQMVCKCFKEWPCPDSQILEGREP